VLTLLLSQAAYTAGAWRLIPDRSKLEFTAAWEDTSFEGIFNRFQTDIRFDPNDLERSSFHVTVDVSSADTNSRDRDEGMADADWFDYRNFPIATFQANRFHPLGKDRFEAEGRLTLKGITCHQQSPMNRRPAILKLHRQ
jgi:polyisoprenoid-binding protein YceI